MNRAKVIGPSRRISSRIASTQLRVRGHVLRRPRDALQVHDRPPSTSRSPGPTRVWPPRSDRDRRVADGRRQRPQPRIGDPVRQQQVAREAVLGARPAPLVRAEPVGEQDPAVDRGPRRRARSAARRGPRGHRGRAAGRGSSGPGAAPAGASGSRAPRSGPGSGTRCGLPARRGRGAEARPATRSSRDAIRGGRPDSGERGPQGGDVEVAAGEGLEGPSRRPSGPRPAASPGRPGAASDRGGRGRSTPARSRSRGSPLSEARSGSSSSGPVPGDRDRVGGVAVVREGRARGTRGRVDERRAIAPPGQRQAAGAEDDDAVAGRRPDPLPDAPRRTTRRTPARRRSRRPRRGRRSPPR